MLKLLFFTSRYLKETPVQIEMVLYFTLYRLVEYNIQRRQIDVCGGKVCGMME